MVLARGYVEGGGEEFSVDVVRVGAECDEAEGGFDVAGADAAVKLAVEVERERCGVAQREGILLVFGADKVRFGGVDGVSAFRIQWASRWVEERVRMIPWVGLSFDA